MLGVVESMKAFPAKRFFNAGVKFSINRDDPQPFGGISLNHEYEQLYRECGMTYHELKQVARDGFEYSFAPPKVKAQLLKEFDEAVARMEAEESNASQSGGARSTKAGAAESAIPALSAASGSIRSGAGSGS